MLKRKKVIVGKSLSRKIPSEIWNKNTEDSFQFRFMSIAATGDVMAPLPHFLIIHNNIFWHISRPDSFIVKTVLWAARIERPPEN